MAARLRSASLLLLSVPALLAGQVRPGVVRVDRYLARQVAERPLPGVAVAVMQDGKIIFAKGYGFANLEHRVPVKPETVFQSGSMGKQFTATGVMMLVEEGKLRLDEPVSTYLPDAPESWKGITIRRLLTHTSGLGDYPDSTDFRRDHTEDEFLKMVYGTPLQFAPGAKWSYSNLGYLTLGVVIHRVSGQFYGDFLHDRIFKPLGMTATRIISEADLVPNRAAGYVRVGGEFKNQEWVSPTFNTTADGALYFNVLDLAKWDAALSTEQLLTRASFEEMWTPVRLTDGSTYPYGFGWGVSETGGHKIVAHSGAWQGFLTHIRRDLADRLTVVVLTNVGSKEARPDQIADQVATLIRLRLTP